MADQPTQKSPTETPKSEPPKPFSADPSRAPSPASAPHSTAAPTAAAPTPHIQTTPLTEPQSVTPAAIGERKPPGPRSTYEICPGKRLYIDPYGVRQAGDLILLTDEEASAWSEADLKRVGDEKEIARRHTLLHRHES